MKKPQVWKYVVGGLVIVALVAGGIYFGKTGTFKGSFVRLRGVSPITYMQVGANGYPATPSAKLPNVYINMYKVSPVTNGVYVGTLSETRRTGAKGEPVSIKVDPNEIVNFVAFKDYTLAQNVTSWTFTSPPYKRFNTETQFCQINYMDSKTKMTMSVGGYSCTTSMTTPTSDKEVAVAKTQTRNPKLVNFEIMVQENGQNPLSVVRNADVKLYDDATNQVIAQVNSGFRGIAGFLIEPGRKFYAMATSNGKLYGGKWVAGDKTPRVWSVKATDSTRRFGVYPNSMSFDAMMSFIPNEDCLTFNPKKLDYIKEKDGTYTMTDGVSRMAVFPNWAEFTKALLTIQNGGFTEHCFVGRGQKDEPMEYWLNAKHTMATGKLNTKEDCVSFNRANLNVKTDSKGAYLMEGKTHSMLSASTEAAINARKQVIDAYKATSMCYVGRPDASMIYFKK
ncbi:MAG: hypothetical protein WCT53_06205 [Candidatus Gracilibacteria bacterium]